jgi:hypothetical protein
MWRRKSGPEGPVELRVNPGAEAPGSLRLPQSGLQRFPSAKAMLGLGDFAALDAVGADADALGGSVDQGVDSLQVWVPATPGYVVRVRDVIAELRAFAANVAYLCHGSNSRIFLQSVYPD